MHGAVATKDHGYVWHVSGLKRIASEDIDPRVEEWLYDVWLEIRMQDGRGTHGEIVQRAREARWKIRELLDLRTTARLSAPTKRIRLFFRPLAWTPERSSLSYSRAAWHFLRPHSFGASSRQISGDSVLRFAVTYLPVYAVFNKAHVSTRRANLELRLTRKYMVGASRLPGIGTLPDSNLITHFVTFGCQLMSVIKQNSLKASGYFLTKLARGPLFLRRGKAFFKVILFGSRNAKSRIVLISSSQLQDIQIHGESLTMRKQKGFSLIELLIVVAIILIIAAIAIPNLLRSRIAANEASAVGSLRSVNTAEVTYASTYPLNGFAPDLNTLGPGSTTGNSASSTNAILLDSVLGCTTMPCTKSGYLFSVTPGTGTPLTYYSSNANPVTVNQTGNRYFYSDASGVIRYNASSVASSSDSPLQ